MKSVNLWWPLYENITKVLLPNIHSSVHKLIIGKIVSEVGEVDGWPMIWVSSRENVKVRVARNVTEVIRHHFGENNTRLDRR